MDTTRIKIINIIKIRGQISAHEMGGLVGIGQSMLHRHLKKLIEENLITKTGIPPKVYYSIKNDQVPVDSIEDRMTYPAGCTSATGFDPTTGLSCASPSTTREEINVINENFTLLEPDGNEIEGFNGFVKWCEDRSYKIAEKAREYVSLLKEYETFEKEGFINATRKIKTSFSQKDTYLDELYYMYPYSLPVFGKTKMGQWLFFAKQTQGRKLMQKVLDTVVPRIQEFIRKEKVEAVAFIPPTVPRKIQFMKELEKKISVNLPVIEIEKIKTQIAIQQKSLKDLKDRIINADSTMFVKARNQEYRRVLVIDDFTGSGATLNVVAKKIKKQNTVDKVIGLTIAGSMNGFEVIREV